MGTKKLLTRFFAGIMFPRFRNPEYMNSNMLKFFFWQKILRINSKVTWPVHFTSKIISPSNIHGSRAEGFRPLGMAVGNYIDARSGVVVEENVHVGPHVAIISRNHDICEYSKYAQSDSIILRKNCWLATGCKILAGVELGEHTVVGAGAVVTHSFPEGNQLIAGSPAKVIKQLPPYKENKNEG